MAELCKCLEPTDPCPACFDLSDEEQTTDEQQASDWAEYVSMRFDAAVNA